MSRIIATLLADRHNVQNATAAENIERHMRESLGILGDKTMAQIEKASDDAVFALGYKTRPGSSNCNEHGVDFNVIDGLRMAPHLLLDGDFYALGVDGTLYYWPDVDGPDASDARVIDGDRHEMETANAARAALKLVDPAFNGDSTACGDSGANSPDLRAGRVFDTNYEQTMQRHEGTDTWVGGSVFTGLIAVRQVNDEGMLAMLTERSGGGDLMTGTPSIEVTLGNTTHFLNWSEAYSLGFALQRIADVSNYG